MRLGSGAAVRAGAAIASSQGSASEAPAPRSRVRREIGFQDIYFVASLLVALGTCGLAPSPA